MVRCGAVKRTGRLLGVSACIPARRTIGYGLASMCTVSNIDGLLCNGNSYDGGGKMEVNL
jgi:hypothetical protein